MEAEKNGSIAIIQKLSNEMPENIGQLENMKLIFILIIIIILLICLWIYGFNEANDFKIHTKRFDDFKNIKKVLIVFPHPDDEANSLSGTITQMVKNDIEVDWVILSKGEKGNEDAHYDERLKEIRVKEAQRVRKILGINSLVFYDYSDNGMNYEKDRLINDLKQVLNEHNPDLVITYDQSGSYGHPDHIIVSNLITELLKADFKNVHLWYTSTPDKLYKKLNHATQMAKDKDFLIYKKSPSMKIFIGINGLINKIESIYTYQSQFKSFVKAVPIKQIPMWFYISLTPYEYFYEVK